MFRICKAKVLLTATFLLVGLIIPLKAQDCSFTVGGANPNKPCAFPFKFKGQQYRTCTDYSDPDGKFWCSTKVDRNGKHVGKAGEWGYCAEGCTESTVDSVEGGVGM